MEEKKEKETGDGGEDGKERQEERGKDDGGREGKRRERNNKMKEEECSRGDEKEEMRKGKRGMARRRGGDGK